MFLSFESQEDRREYGGSGFIEFQFCKMSSKSKIESIVTIDNIKHWQPDSLYVSDYDEFFNEYSRFFNCGFYNNMKNGIIDIYGVNYYTSVSVETIMSRIEKDQPKDYHALLDWLRKSKKYNGIYILGV